MNERLITELHTIAQRQDRAVLAKLRRGLAYPHLAAYPYVARFFPAKASRNTQDSMLLVAALFATFPLAGRHSIGSGLRVVSIATRSASVEPRFVALLNADREDLPTHLRHTVNLLKGHSVALDWNNLLDSLKYWNAQDRNVQAKWARDFWATSEGKEEQL